MLSFRIMIWYNISENLLSKSLPVVPNLGFGPKMINVDKY